MAYYDKSKKKWRGRVMVNGETSSALFATKREARDWEVGARKRLKQRTSTVYLVQAANEYLTYAQRRFHKTTYETKSGFLRGLISELGDCPLSSITPKQILNVLQDLSSTSSQFNERRKHLRAFFQWCVDFQQLLKNPVTVKRLPRDPGPQRVPTDQEVARLMTAANRWERNFLTAFLTTGARKEEILRWTWGGDIDFEGSRVRLGTRKSAGGDMKYRWINMGETLRKALEDQLATRLPTSDYVFQNRKKGSKSYGDRFITRKHFIKQLCARANIGSFGYHALRRWFTSVLARRGTPLPALQKLLGHSRPSTTDRYVYAVSEDSKKAVDLFDTMEVFRV